MRFKRATITTLALVLLIHARTEAQSGSLQFITYPCKHKSANDVAGILRPLLPESPSVQLVVDREQNRILLNGPDDVQAIARRVVNEVDRPPANSPPADRGSGMRVYSVPPERQRAFLQRLNSEFGQTGLRTSADAQNGQVFVHAPTVVHQAIAQMVAAAAPSLQPVGSPPAAAPSGTRFVFVPPALFARVQQQLAAIFANRMTIRRIGAREILVLDLGRQPPARLEVEFDETKSGVHVAGASNSVNQMVSLIQAIGNERDARGLQTRIFRVHRSNQRSLREIVIPATGDQGPMQDANEPMGQVPARRVYGPVAPAAYVLQEDGAGVTPMAQPPANDGQGQPSAPMRQFEGVDIEALPDLDVIILRGRDEDLDQLAEIIEQLERISQETQPEIRIYTLRHAQSEAVAELVEQSSDDLVSGRTGKVAVSPLVKPNALLLIGWGDAVAAVVQLIQHLDQPVNPRAGSVVFRLRHAPANAVEQTITNFFSERPGLGPRVQVTVDARTNSLIVYAAPRDIEEVRRMVQDLDRPDSAAVNRAHIFQIQNALAADVADTLQQAIEAAVGNADRSAILELQTFDAEGRRILRSGTLENVKITPNPRNNTIIVSSPQENLELIAELINQLDSPAVQAQIKVFGIVNGDAASLVETLRSLLPSQPGIETGPQLSSAAGDPSLAPLRFSVDVRSNSIIATGSEGDLRIVEALLVKLDQSTTFDRSTEVFQLKNSPAIDVASAVNQFLISRRQIEEAVPGADNPFQDIEREVVVVPEPVANKLVLAATPRYFEEIKALIEKLDEQPPQVMIQVLIAEVALSDTDEFGVELGLQDSVLFDRSLLGDLLTTTNSFVNTTTGASVSNDVIQGATNLPGFIFNNIAPLGNSGSDSSLATAGTVGGQGISNFSVGRGNDQLGFGGLVLSASSRNVSVLIRALEESRRVDILSRPQIRTLDNQPAFIQVGQRVPRIVGSTVNQNGQSNSVTLENVGLILGVTPRISPDGTVVMEIDAERSRVGPEEEGIPVAVSIDGTVIRSPRVNTATAQATVSAADGETIVLGGLITEDKQEVHRKVPWLGDIPLLHHLFRYDGFEARRAELLIILTPRVIRTSYDNELIRQVEMARMSWCAADVFALHGDVGFVTDTPLEMLESGQPEVIYPDLAPSGEPSPFPESQYGPPPSVIIE